MRRLLSLIAASGICAMSLAACSSSTDMPSDLQGLTGEQIVQLVYNAMEAQGSVNVNQTIRSGGQVATVAISTSDAEALEITKGAFGAGRITIIGSLLFVQGDTRFLHHLFPDGVDPRKWAHVAIQVPQNSPHFLPIATTLSFSYFVAGTLPVAPFVVRGVHTVNGQQVVEVQGRVNSKDEAGTTGTLLYLFAIKKPHLPVAAIGSLTSGSTHLASRVDFVSWGGTPPARAPIAYIQLDQTTLG